MNIRILSVLFAALFLSGCCETCDTSSEVPDEVKFTACGPGTYEATATGLEPPFVIDGVSHPVETACYSCAGPGDGGPVVPPIDGAACAGVVLPSVTQCGEGTYATTATGLELPIAGQQVQVVCLACPGPGDGPPVVPPIDGTACPDSDPS